MPVDASIPLSYNFPKFMTPADTLSLRDLATQTKLRQAELEDLPAKRQYERETRRLNQEIQLGQLAQSKAAQDWERQQKRDDLRKNVNQIGFNTVQLGRTRGLADTMLANNMRQAMVGELDRAKQGGKLALMGIDEPTYQQLRAGIMEMTPDQIEAAVSDPAKLQERADYAPIPGVAAPQGAAQGVGTMPQTTGGMFNVGGQQSVPLSGIPNVVQSPESAVPNPDTDILSDSRAQALLERDLNPYPDIPENATQRERAMVQGYLEGESPEMPPTVPLSNVAGLETNYGVGQAGAVPRETAATQQTPWDQLDAQADALEARGGRVNYDRAQNLRKRAEELRDNDRAERTLNKEVQAQNKADAAQKAKLNKEANDLEQKMSDDFIKASGTFVDTRDAFTRINVSAKNPSPAGDLSLMFNYMKMLDPGSVVRESEFAQIAATGSYGERLQAAATRFLSGERLTPDQRSDFVGRAREIYAEMERNHSLLENQFKKRAKEYGVNPDHVIMNFRPATTGTLSKPRKGDIEDGYRFKGGDPGKQENWEKVE